MEFQAPRAGNTFFTLFPLLAGLLAAGCVSTAHLAQSEELFQTGSYECAAQTLRASMPEDDSDLDGSGQVLNALYLGSAEFMAGHPKPAEEAFSHALKGIESQDEAVLDKGLHYTGKPYDGIMAGTYRALSLWMEGETDRSRVAFRNVAETQGKVSEDNARRIRKLKEKEQKELEDGTTDQELLSQTVKSTMESPSNQKALELFKKDMAEWGCYDSYENPASYFLDAVFALANSEGASDLEHASFSCRKAHAMAPSAPAQSLFEIAEGRADGKISASQLDDVVIVLFENGLGPTLREEQLDLMIPVGNELYYVGMALPKLVMRQGAYPELILRDGPDSLGMTQRICDFNKIVTASYRDALPRVIASEVLECAIKVVLQYQATQKAKEQYGEDAATLVSLTGSMLAKSMTHADIRMWKLLPYDFQAAVIRKPASGRLSLCVNGSVDPIGEVKIPKDGPSVLYVKIPAPGLPPLLKWMPSRQP